MASRKRDISDGSDPKNATETHLRPPKRSRKAVNCEPCRASKLKCDRKRPCSGCEIRGTTELCYPEETVAAKDEPGMSQADVRSELERMQLSLRALEAALPRQGDFSSSTNTSTIDGRPGTAFYATTNGTIPLAGWERFSQENRVKLPTLYIGPAAAPVAFLIGRNEETGLPDAIDPQNPPEVLNRSENYSLFEEYDSLPNNHILADSLLGFFFDNCTYLMYIVDRNIWFEEWHRERSRTDTTNVLTLATAYMMIGIAMNYLPDSDPIITQLPQEMTRLQLGRRLYAASLRCISRYRALRSPPCLPWVELLLLRCQYLTVTETVPTEAWAVKSDIGSAASALALHRDPGAWQMLPSDIARRRWAWWNYVSLDRWQAFLFGRPFAVQSRHFDTKFPVGESPSPHSTASDIPDLVHLAKFRLIVILADILHDTLSTRPVSYERAKIHDQALEQWRNSLPSDLRLDDLQSIARALTLSTSVGVKFTMLQSIYLRTTGEHIRFVLHQQYATARICPDLSPSITGDATKDGILLASAECLQATVHSAGMVIDVLREMVPLCSSNVFLALPGHAAWSENALFSAAIFFADLLIARPNQPNRELFRDHIYSAMYLLGQLEFFVPHAGNARVVLQALSPLFNDDLDEAGRAAQVDAIRSLTFPSHQCPLINLKSRLARAQTKEEPASPGTLKSSPGQMMSTSNERLVSGVIVLHHPRRSAAAPMPVASEGSDQAARSRTYDGEDWDGGDSEEGESDGGEDVLPPPQRSQIVELPASIPSAHHMQDANRGAVFQSQPDDRTIQYSFSQHPASTSQPLPIAHEQQSRHPSSNPSTITSHVPMSHQHMSTPVHTHVEDHAMPQMIGYSHHIPTPSSTSTQPQYSDNVQPRLPTDSGSTSGLTNVIPHGGISYARSTGPEQYPDPNPTHAHVSTTQFSSQTQHYERQQQGQIAYNVTSVPLYPPPQLQPQSQQLQSASTFRYSPSPVHPSDQGYQQPYKGESRHDGSSEYDPQMHSQVAPPTSYPPPPPQVQYHDGMHYVPPTASPISQQYHQSTPLHVKPPEGTVQMSQPYSDRQAPPSVSPPYGSHSTPWHGNQQTYWS